MVTLLLNQVVAVWLFVSALVLPHSSATSWNSILIAGAVSAVALLAFAAPGRPGVRYLLAVIAAWLFMSALVMPHESLGTVLHDVFVSLVLAAVSLFPPARWLTHWREEHTGQAHPTG